MDRHTPAESRFDPEPLAKPEAQPTLNNLPVALCEHRTGQALH